MGNVGCPLNELLLNELRFWLRIMKEHALFIRLGLPCNETRLIQMAQDFESRFAELEEKSKAVSPGRGLDQLANDSLKAVLDFIQYKTLVLDRIIECRMGGANYPLLIDHIRREAIRFAINIIRFRRGELMTPTEELIQDEVFWLRIMADHAKFIAHLLDPSERRFVCQAEMFSDTFDNLRCQSEDFESMLEITPRPIPSLLRFTAEVKEAGTEIRNFKAAATQLLTNCKILSLIPPLLADHVRREAEKFLMDLDRDLRMLKQMPAPSAPPCATSPPVLENTGDVSQEESLKKSDNTGLHEKEQGTETLSPTDAEQTTESFAETGGSKTFAESSAEISETVAEKLKEDFAAPLQPIYRPKKTFFTGNTTQVKINFK